MGVRAFHVRDRSGLPPVFEPTDLPHQGPGDAEVRRQDGVGYPTGRTLPNHTHLLCIELTRPGRGTARPVLLGLRGPTTVRRPASLHTLGTLPARVVPLGVDPLHGVAGAGLGAEPGQEGRDVVAPAGTHRDPAPTVVHVPIMLLVEATGLDTRPGLVLRRARVPVVEVAVVRAFRAIQSSCFQRDFGSAVSTQKHLSCPRPAHWGSLTSLRMLNFLLAIETKILWYG